MRYRTTRYSICVTPAGLTEPRPLQLDPLGELVEEATAPPEQDIDHVDPDLVHEPRGQELLIDVRAHQPDSLVAGRFPGLREGTLDPVRDEREHRVRARGRVVSDYEARDVAEGALATPLLDRVVVGPAAHDHRARFLDQLAVQELEHRRIVKHPVVEPHPVLAQPLLGIAIWAPRCSRPGTCSCR